MMHSVQNDNNIIILISIVHSLGNYYTYTHREKIDIYLRIIHIYIQMYINIDALIVKYI